MLIPLDAIRDAAARTARHLHRTPVLSSSSLGERSGVRLHLKCESFQKTGSFKPRGALNIVLSMPEERRQRGLITVSAGNHAQAVAWAARVAHAPCTVVMPTDAPRSKMEATRGYGATIITHDDRATLFDRLVIGVLNNPRKSPLFSVDERIAQITEGAFDVKPGSLFPALHRLEEKGWLASEWGESETRRRAKYYRLTAAGRKRLRVEAEQWERVSLAIGWALKAT